MSVICILVTIGGSALIHPVRAADPLMTDIQKRIEQRIQAEAGKQTFVCYTEMLCGIALVPAFYAERRYMPAWIAKDGSMPLSDQLMVAIQNADREGLDPNAYHLAALQEIMASVRFKDADPPLERARLLADLDILLTDAFLLFGSHLLAGRVNPETVHTGWIVKGHENDLMRSIGTALASRQIENTLFKLKPPHAAYAGLRHRLAFYRNIENNGGWPAIPAGPSLRSGDRNRRVETVRNRLLASGDLEPGMSNEPPDFFDDATVSAVQSFQARHGLAPDGIVGRRTIGTMNVPVEKRIRQIELNLERWRWLPHRLGERHLVVNIADFSLSLVEDQKDTLTMRVVVGRPYRKTPVFSADMTYLVINPYWNIPTKIAVQDMLPAIQQDATFLKRNRISVFADWSEGAPELDVDAIDWQAAGWDHFPYKLRQNPGPDNALGRIKFMFPNKFAVYIHDTPHRALFDEAIRGFSSGCIRAEKPIPLAHRLMENLPEWTPDRLADALKGGEQKVIRLREPVAVHLLYLTAWVDKEERLQFREDIYDRDPPLDEALKEMPPRVRLFPTQSPGP